MANTLSGLGERGPKPYESLSLLKYTHLLQHTGMRRLIYRYRRGQKSLLADSGEVLVNLIKIIKIRSKSQVRVRSQHNNGACFMWDVVLFVGLEVWIEEHLTDWRPTKCTPCAVCNTGHNGYEVKQVCIPLRKACFRSQSFTQTRNARHSQRCVASKNDDRPLPRGFIDLVKARPVGLRTRFLQEHIWGAAALWQHELALHRTVQRRV